MRPVFLGTSVTPRHTTRPDQAIPPIMVLFTVVAGTLAVAAGFYLATLRGGLPFPQDIGKAILGRDFMNSWFFGKAAFLSDPGRFYDHDLYMHWLNEVVPQEAYNHLWSYPPNFFLMAAPLGVLPYPVAFAAWTGAGLLALYAVVWGQPLRTFAILLSPAAFFCLISGQISLFMAAFSLAALRLLDTRPVTAGLLIALCTIKPQMGLLFPVLLIASRRWTVFVSAALGTLALILSSGLIWGFGIWQDYIAMGIPAQIADTKDTFEALAPWSPTATTALIMAGLPQNLASLIQLGFTCLAAALVVLYGARGPMGWRDITFFLACSVFASPYLLTHDLVALTAAGVMLAASEPLDARGNLAIKALYLLPLLQFAAAALHVPAAAAIPVWIAFWALPQRDPAPNAPAAAQPITL